MLHSWTLRDLLDSGVTVRVGEAVAIVQRLMHDDPAAFDATSPYGPLTLHNVEIASDGHLRCTGTAATVSVYEAAALLQELLSAGAGAIPGALRYTLGRALLEVEAPPFDSRQQFSAALERFEDGPRAEVIAALHARASSRDTTPADRRRATATHAALRRELRDADLRLYAATIALRPPLAQGDPRRSAGPIAGCVLAGAALIAAGGAASTVHRRTPADSPRPASEPRVLTRDIALPPQATTPPSVPRVQTPMPLAPRPARVDSSPAAAARKGSRLHAARSGARRPVDPDRGVIARIRFEWDNPFR